MPRFFSLGTYTALTLLSQTAGASAQASPQPQGDACIYSTGSEVLRTFLDRADARGEGTSLRTGRTMLAGFERGLFNRNFVGVVSAGSSMEQSMIGAARHILGQNPVSDVVNIHLACSLATEFKQGADAQLMIDHERGIQRLYFGNRVINLNQ